MFKKYIITAALSVAMFAGVYCQVPQSFSYQGVACGINGAELTNQDISVKFTILQGGMNGTPVYLEQNDIQTDEFGLFVINVGQGGNNFDRINWSLGPFYLKTDMDVDLNGNFSTLGITEIHSVPFALYSENSGNADTSSYSRRALIADSAADDMDRDPANELQNLDYTDGVLSISNGNSFTFDVSDADSDPSNEIQQITFDDGIITLNSPDGVENSIDIYQDYFSRNGASFAFPHGILGRYKTITEINYTVPQGMVFYVTASDRTIDLPTFNEALFIAPSMPVFAAGTIIRNCECTGFEVPESANIQVRIYDFNTINNIIVPAGKTLFLKSGFDGLENIKLIVNTRDIRFASPGGFTSLNGLIFESGTLLEISNPDNGTIFTGYLLDN